MSAESTYAREMRKGFGGYFAAWTPGSPVALGDVGVVEGSVFRKLGHLGELKIPFTERPDDTPEDIGPYMTYGAATVSFKASGAASPPQSQLAQADAGFTVTFAKRHAVCFVARGCYQPAIQDQLTLGDRVLEAFRAGAWNRSWHVVTQVVNATSATVLISDAKRGAVDLKVAGSIAGVPGAGSLADVDAGLSLQFATGMHTTLVGASKLTPLFKLGAIQKRIFQPPVFHGSLAMARAPAGDPARLPLEAVTHELLARNPRLLALFAFDTVTP